MDNDQIKRPLIIRTDECDARYRAERERHEEGYDPFEERGMEEALRSFTYWFVLENRFPYDAVADTHHLLIPRRKFSKPAEMNEVERAELEMIKMEVAPEYDCIIENFPRAEVRN